MSIIDKSFSAGEDLHHLYGKSSQILHKLLQANQISATWLSEISSFRRVLTGLISAIIFHGC